MDAEDSLTREALRRHRSYLVNVVERYSFCPWAKAARVNGRVRAHVVVGSIFSACELRSVVDRWAEDADCDVGFILVPEFRKGIEAFARWTERVGELRSDVFLTAAFHPNAPREAGVVRFLRQSPDPTVQLVRRSRLDEVRAQDPPHYQDIFALDLDALRSTTPTRTVADAVLARNRRVVTTHRRLLAELLCGDPDT